MADHERVKSMEVAVVLSPDDLTACPEVAGASADGGIARGFRFSGSQAGRNIEAIYAGAKAAGVPTDLSSAVEACFVREVPLRHVLICSGFFVLHGAHAPSPGLVPGSCETDGPLGALGLLRTFVARGVRVSLFCDVQTGPVLRAGYEAMIQHFSGVDPAIAREFCRLSRVLPFVSGTAPLGETAAEAEAFRALFAATFPDEDAEPASLRSRSLRTAAQVKDAVHTAWSGEDPGPIDCLFALERLGAPYRNIRGRDLSEHTVPVDCLWPLISSACDEELASLDGESSSRIGKFAAESGITVATTEALRSIAGVTSDALTLGIGDGGNEVGMGKVAHLEGISLLAPGGNPEFVPLSVNGCFRSCDRLILGTVSNWAGCAFEMASHVLQAPATDYIAALRRCGFTIADCELFVLDAIMAPPACSVDGIDPSRTQSVDGMPFQPNHRELYDMLWQLGHAEVEIVAAA